MAVVVQRQLSPDLCFVLHTRHPGEPRRRCARGHTGACSSMQLHGRALDTWFLIVPSPAHLCAPPAPAVTGDANVLSAEAGAWPGRDPGCRWVAVRVRVRLCEGLHGLAVPAPALPASPHTSHPPHPPHPSRRHARHAVAARGRQILVRRHRGRVWHFSRALLPPGTAELRATNGAQYAPPSSVGGGDTAVAEAAPPATGVQLKAVDYSQQPMSGGWVGWGVACPVATAAGNHACPSPLAGSPLPLCQVTAAPLPLPCPVRPPQCRPTCARAWGAVCWRWRRSSRTNLAAHRLEGGCGGACWAPEKAAPRRRRPACRAARSPSCLRPACPPARRTWRAALWVTSCLWCRRGRSPEAPARPWLHARACAPACRTCDRPTHTTPSVASLPC